MRLARVAGLCLPLLASSVAFAADTMTPAEFCKGLDTRLKAVRSKCDTKKAEIQSAIQLIDVTRKSSNCTDQLKDVEISKSKATACLDTVSWKSNDIAILDQKQVCRDAMKGLKKEGAACMLDVQCPSGSYCTPKPAGDPMDKFCSPVITKGAACMTGAGDTCGPTLQCVANKCEPRPQTGEACLLGSVKCVDGLRCLLTKGGEKSGVCGAERKTGEVCRHWYECSGVCAMTGDEGVCIAACGAN